MKKILVLYGSASYEHDVSLLSMNTIKENIDYLHKIILAIDTLEECEAIFDDLCTKNELASISQRLVVAKMLMDKKVYSDIVAETGASTATISRVNRSLEDSNNGYDIVFERLEK